MRLSRNDPPPGRLELLILQAFFGALRGIDYLLDRLPRWLF